MPRSTGAATPTPRRSDADPVMRPFLTLHSPAAARRYYAEGRWRDDTFYSLMAGHAAATPDRPALQDGQRVLTWAELRAEVDALAEDFRTRGLVPGDRVSLWLSNKAEAIIAFLACAREGLACNPSLHRTYTCAEIVALLNRLKTRVLITEDGWSADRASTDFRVELADVPSLRKCFDIKELPRGGAATRPAWDDPDSVLYLAFTSGTTGAPKCVMHSNNTLLSNARDLVAAWSIDADTVLLTLSPLSHHIAWVAVGQWVLSGCRLATDDPAPGQSRLDWIVETGATYVMGVPTHAMDILTEQQKRGLARIGKVEIFYMAGAPIPDVVAEAFVAQGIKPQNVYGMTENSSHQFTHPDDDPATWVSTCGRGGPGYEVRIFDAENADRPAKTGEIGQIAGRGANLMLGYFANQTATEESFNADGWFLSGDLGRLDAAGNLQIKGRLKDLIIRGGHNIHPSHIEALALRSERIEMAAAFAVPDDRLGERVCLAVKGRLTGQQTLDHLWSAGLSKFDMPEYFLALDSFPLTPSGKILKRELETQVAEAQLTPEPIRFKPKEA